jgi:hypothetical protein
MNHINNIYLSETLCIDKYLLIIFYKINLSENLHVDKELFYGMGSNKISFICS